MIRAYVCVKLLKKLFSFLETGRKQIIDKYNRIGYKYTKHIVLNNNGFNIKSRLL